MTSARLETTDRHVSRLARNLIDEAADHVRRRGFAGRRAGFFVFFGVIFFFDARDFDLTKRIGGAGPTPPGTVYDITTMPLRGSVF